MRREQRFYQYAPRKNPISELLTTWVGFDFFWCRFRAPVWFLIALAMLVIAGAEVAQWDHGDSVIVESGRG